MTEENDTRVSSEEESSSKSNEASQSRQRRKRKWDQPAESLVSAGIAIPGVVSLGNEGFLGGITIPGASPVSTVLLNNTPPASSAGVPSVLQANSIPQQTAAVLQKLNQPKSQDELIIAREIVINDAESSVRYKLTKRQTQEEIQKCTGAVVITRGKYRPPNAPPDGEKPLFLHISAAAHLKETAERILAVDRAAAMVEEMLKQGQTLPPVSSSFLTAMATGVKVTQPLTTCVHLGFEADPSMNIVARIRGPNDQYINHIMNETGATVILRGHGLGNTEGANGEDEHQPLHLFLSSNDPKSLEDAKRLAENLLDTISVEFGASRVSSYKVHSAVPPPPQVYGVIPTPQQVYGAVPLPPPQQIHTVISSAQQVYSAVPPPQQLLLGVQSSGIVAKSIASMSTMGLTSSVPPVSPVAAPGIPTIHPQGTLPQPGVVLNGAQLQANLNGHTSPLISGGTSYIGYGGIYPQATPLQQVALALKHSPPVASTVSPTTSVPRKESKSSNSSDSEKEKRPQQKRKFQELPAGSKGPTKPNQGSESLKPLEQAVDLAVRNLSTIPATKNKLEKRASNGMPPPPPRTMPPPPPPPKFLSSTPDAKLSDKSKILNKPTSDIVPDTLVKLMEYGEDDDDDPDDTPEESISLPLGAVTAPKPFWAV